MLSSAWYGIMSDSQVNKILVFAAEYFLTESAFVPPGNGIDVFHLFVRFQCILSLEIQRALPARHQIGVVRFLVAHQRVPRPVALGAGLACVLLGVERWQTAAFPRAVVWSTVSGLYNDRRRRWIVFVRARDFTVLVNHLRLVFECRCILWRVGFFLYRHRRENTCSYDNHAGWIGTCM